MRQALVRHLSWLDPYRLRRAYAAKDLVAEKHAVENLEYHRQGFVDLADPLACEEPAPAGRRRSVRVRECA